MAPEKTAQMMQAYLEGQDPNHCAGGVYNRDLLAALAQTAPDTAQPDKLSDFIDAFMLCVAGDGAPYVKVQFSDLKRAQEFHSVLIREMGRRELRPFKGVARDGIEAQNGINDTYAGDPYP